MPLGNDLLGSPRELDMRSTNEIVIAVQECQPCSDEELRLCIMSLKARLYFATKAANNLAEAIEMAKPSVKLKAGFWKRDAETRFRSNKMPVDEYLGSANIPGTQEYNDRLRVAKAICKKATGIEL